MSAELKKRDYTSFGSVAKARFRPMTEALSFEQSTPTIYHRKRLGWYDFIMLETSRHGGNGFEIHYGIWRKKSELKMHDNLSKELKRSDGKPTKWNRFTKEDIELASNEAHEMFLLQAEPFLQSFKSKRDVGLAYLDGIAFRLNAQLNGDVPRNETFIQNSCEFLEWADMDDAALQIQEGIFESKRKVSFFRKWILPK